MVILVEEEMRGGGVGGVRRGERVREGEGLRGKAHGLHEPSFVANIK